MRQEEREARRLLCLRHHRTQTLCDPPNRTLRHGETLPVLRAVLGTGTGRWITRPCLAPGEAGFRVFRAQVRFRGVHVQVR